MSVLVFLEVSRFLFALGGSAGGLTSSTCTFLRFKDFRVFIDDGVAKFVSTLLTETAKRRELRLKPEAAAALEKTSVGISRLGRILSQDRDECMRRGRRSIVTRVKNYNTLVRAKVGIETGLCHRIKSLEKNMDCDILLERRMQNISIYVLL